MTVSASALHIPASATQNEPVPARPRRKKGTKRTITLALVLVAVVTASYVLPVRAWLHNAEAVRHAVLSLGIWAYPATTLAIAILIAVGVPRLLLCTICGMVLGLWPGLLIGEIGTVLSYYSLFIFVRHGGREWALHRWPKLNKWAQAVHDQGAIGVILLRQLPIHGTLINVSLGLSHVKHRHFLIGTAIGVIPELIPAVLVGTGLGEGSGKSMATYMSIGIVAFVMIWIGCTYAVRIMRRNRTEAAMLADEVESEEA